MKKLLWIGDAACPSGFARATHAILNTLRHEFDVTVLGLNYRGDPHEYPYPIYAAGAIGDAFGVDRMIWMCDLVKETEQRGAHRINLPKSEHAVPDVILIQNDGWNISDYTQRLRMKKSNGEYAFPEFADIPVVAIVAVDGKNFQGAWLDGVAHAIFWTQFALDEARLGGYVGPASVIPLGIDTEVYRPLDKLDARSRVLPKELDDAYIVGNVNRNQPRKRLDLTIRYFAEWITEYKVTDAYLFLHVAPTGDSGVDLEQLMRYYGVLNRFIHVRPPVWYGKSERYMVDTYNCFDVQVSTTQGEGFGLTTFEGMACGVPQIVPAWSALQDLTKDAAWQVKCSSTATTIAYGPPVNVIGGIPDQEAFIHALNVMYENPHYRENNRQAGLERVHESRFAWSNIGRAYVDMLDSLLADKKEQVA